MAYYVYIELSHKYPYRIKIIQQEGDLTLLRHAIEGKHQNISVNISIKEFDEIFASNAYGFKSNSGSRLTYNFWQLGKILT